MIKYSLGNTPKAFANPSPGFELCENPGTWFLSSDETLTGFAKRGTLSGFAPPYFMFPWVVAGAPTLGWV